MQPNQQYAPCGPAAPQQPPASSSLHAQLLSLSQKLETAARTHAPALTSSVDRVMHSEPVGRLMAAVGLSNTQQPASSSYAPYPQHYPHSHPQQPMQCQQHQQHEHHHPQQQHYSQPPPGAPQPSGYQPPAGPYPYPYPPHSQQPSHALSPHPAQQYQHDYAYQQWQQQQWQQQQPPYMYSQYPQQQQPAHFGSSTSAAAASAAAASAAAPARDIPTMEATVILEDPSSAATAPRSRTHVAGSSTSSCTVPAAAPPPPPQHHDQHILQHNNSKIAQQQQQQGQSQVLQQLHASAVPAAGAAAASLIGHWLHQDWALLSDLQLLPNGCMHWLRSQQAAAAEAVNGSNGSTGGSGSNAQTGGKGRPGLKIPAWMKRTGAGSRDRVETQQVVEGCGASDTAQLLAPRAEPEGEGGGGSSSSSSSSQEQQLLEWLGVWKLVRGNPKQGQLKLTFVVQGQQQQHVYVLKYQRQALDDAMMLDGIAHIKIS